MKEDKEKPSRGEFVSDVCKELENKLDKTVGSCNFLKKP